MLIRMSAFVVNLLCASQDQFDSIDLSDNAIVRLEGFPRLPRLKVLLLNNNRIAKIARNLEGGSTATTGLKASGVTQHNSALADSNRRKCVTPTSSGLSQHGVSSTLVTTVYVKAFRTVALHLLGQQHVQAGWLPGGSIDVCYLPWVSCAQLPSATWRRWCSPTTK